MADKANGITKVEAVRRALAEMGADATPSQLQPFIKEKFGFDMTPEHITTCKGDIRRKAAGKTKSAAKAKAAPTIAPSPTPVATSPTPAAPEPQAATPSPHQGNGITKIEAVRRALAEMGKDAMPAQMQPFIKQKYGIDITPNHISDAKGKILGTAGKGKPAAKKPAAPKQVVAPKPAAPVMQAAPATPKAAPSKVSGGGVSLQDLGTLKELVGRVGPDSLRTLIDLLAR